MSTPTTPYVGGVPPAATHPSWASESGACIELSAAVEVADRLGRILADEDEGVDRLHLRRLRDELSSHILAARVLIDAGASPSSIAEVGRRARVVMEQAAAASAPATGASRAASSAG